MKVSINWIKEFVDLPEMSPQELGMKFTLATCEVEDVIESGALLKDIIVVDVLEVEKHPNADKLNLVTFNTGEPEPRKVVCGAPNVTPGIRVPFARVGLTLPNGLELTPKKIRGIVSEGMLCSEVELGIGDDASGLMVLPEDAPVGTSLAKFLGIKEDIILDIDNKSLTHRPDLWGHYGMAREFAAVFERELKSPYDEQWQSKIEKLYTDEPSPVSVKVEKDTSGLAYYGLTVENIKIEESPAWMQQRLIDCGLRPKNNIVDISNYVMLELGSPNHIFDKDLIEDGQIIIRRAGKDQEFVTLDGELRQLIANDTMVCDSKKPLVIAGIMGGENSMVNDNTKDVFLEVANWVDWEVRQTSARLGLRTDSSQRYEKCLDTRLSKRSLLRLVELILELCPEARVVGKLEWDGPEAEAPYTPLVIEITTEYINRSLGIQLEKEKIVSILKALDFKVTEDAGETECIKLEVPSYRATKDIDCKAAIVEEIGRIIGFDNITPKSPLWSVEPMRLQPGRGMHRKVRDFFVFNVGALEIYTNPMVGTKLLEKASWHEMNEKLVLLNSLSEDHDRMRPSMVPSLLSVAALNIKNYTRFSMFEIGRSYLSAEKGFSTERSQVTAAFYSKDDSRFMDAVNAVENLLRYLRIPGKLTELHEKNDLLARNWTGLHPHETLDINIMGKSRGFITTVHPMVCRQFKMKGNLSILVLDLTDVESREMKDKTKFQPLPRFPHSIFDCTVVTDPHTPVADVLAALEKLKMKELVSSKVVVAYKLDDERKTVTIRNTFFDENQTLSGEFIKEAEQKVIDALANAGFPLKS